MKGNITRNRRITAAKEDRPRNRILAEGRITEEFSFHKRTGGVNLYTTTLCVYRNTGTEYNLPLLVPQKLIPLRGSNAGRLVLLQGEVRSYNYFDGISDHTAMRVYALRMKRADILCAYPGCDQVFLDGYVCKEPSYYSMPGHKEVTSLILAVPRYYERADYIPLVFQNERAAEAARIHTGTRLLVRGELISRIYRKYDSPASSRLMTTYEVFVTGAQKIEEASPDAVTADRTPLPAPQNAAGSL